MRLNDSTEVCLLFPFVDWQIDNGFFNRPTIAGTPILVHRWGPRIRISALFRFFCEAGYRPREIDILSLIYLKCPEYYGILCNSGTVHAVIPRAVVLFCSSGRASRGQRKSYIRHGAGVSREPDSRVLLWFKRKIKDCLQPMLWLTLGGGQGHGRGNYGHNRKNPDISRAHGQRFRRAKWSAVRTF